MGKEKFEFHDIDLYADQLAKILPSAHMGIWSMCFVEGKRTTFRMDETTRDIVGCDLDISPEDAFDFLNAHIEPKFFHLTLEFTEKVFAGEHQINNHDDGLIIRDAKRKIASALSIPESDSNNALKILFGPQENKGGLFSDDEVEYEEKNKLVKGLSLREFNAFLVNNRDLLVEIFETISSDSLSSIEEKPALSKEWFIPANQYYKQHKYISSTRDFDKNPFIGYGNNVVIAPNRSHTEQVFEYWCESYYPVEWVYKNGDKGDMYFHIVYEMGFARQYFYPDYILKLDNGDIWIIEAKGGKKADGTSNNIDIYAKAKFKAMKRYASEHPEIHWCFARAISSANIVVSNTEWDENVSNNEVWKPIREVVK